MALKIDNKNETGDMMDNIVAKDNTRYLSYVVVRFDKHGQKYTYIAEGDAISLGACGFTHAVVKSPYTDLTIVQICSISGVDLSTYTGNYKPVVTLFNMEAHDAYLERSQRARTLTERLRKKIEERAFIDRAHELLKDDDEAAAMLEELRNLR